MCGGCFICPTNSSAPPPAGVALFVGRTLLVSSRGQAALAARENWTLHFTTIDAAYAASQDGDVIIIAPGTYNIDFNMVAENLTYNTLGKVIINYNGFGYPMELDNTISAFVLDGDFEFNMQGGLGLLHMDNTGNDVYFRWTRANVFQRTAIEILGPYTKDLTIRGDIYQTSFENAIYHTGNPCRVNFYGNVVIEGDINQPAVYVSGNYADLNFFGNITVYGNTNVYALQVANGRSVNIYGDVVNDGYGNALWITGNGGNINILGKITGDVLDDSTAQNIQYQNDLTVNGIMEGRVYAAGKAIMVFNGDVTRTIFSTSKDNHITVYGNFTRVGEPAFTHTDGTLIIYGSFKRANAQPSSQTGGTIYLNGEWIDSAGEYLQVHGLIYHANGTMFVCGRVVNTSASAIGHGIEHDAGDLVMKGGSIVATAATAFPIWCNGVRNLKIYDGFVNRAVFVDVRQIWRLNVTAAVVGYSYQVTLNGTTYGPYVAVGGDTPTSIAGHLFTLIGAPPAVAVANIGGGTLEFTANVAGVPFTLVGTVVNETVTFVQDNQKTPTNLITGTTLIVDIDVV